MSNEEIIQELLCEAEKLKIREDVIDLSERLMDRNPDLIKVDAIDMALKHLKLYC